MTLLDTKNYLKDISAHKDKLRAAANAAAALDEIGADGQKVYAEAEKEIAGQVEEAVQNFLKLPPAEANALIARYIHGQPYEILHEDPLLVGMGQSTAWRLLARAVEDLSQVICG